MPENKTQDWYSGRLRDPRWQQRRLEIFTRDRWTCFLCCDSRSTKHVHHEEYGGDPWEIPNEKLRTICVHCHSILHFLPNYHIEAINKRISLNAKCWEVVVFTSTDLVFLYMFFSYDCHTDVKYEIITVHADYKAAA